VSVAYAARIAALLESLGIPSDYATSRNLQLQPEADAASLSVIAQKADGTRVALAKPAAAAWRQLSAASAAEGIALLPLSGFRSVARQEEIIRAKLARSQPLPEILRTVAAPGYSEHHTGYAVDVGTPEDPELEERFAQTDAFHWLMRHAGRVGFTLSYPRDNPHGIAFEPWHWCWRGK
jgi:D-alanyl-D-alanine carboxypeptidase